MQQEVVFPWPNSDYPTNPILSAIAQSGRVIYEGGCHTVRCDGRNHFAVTASEIAFQCGCFCTDSRFLARGWFPELNDTPFQYPLFSATVDQPMEHQFDRDEAWGGIEIDGPWEMHGQAQGIMGLIIDFRDGARFELDSRGRSEVFPNRILWRAEKTETMYWLTFEDGQTIGYPKDGGRVPQ